MHTLVLLTSIALCAHPQTPSMIGESARRIPVAATVDVVVAGGTLSGVAAALEAAAQGRSVMLVAPRLYLGEDLADTLHLWLEEGENPTGALAEKIFAKPGPVPPLRLKRTLEEALVKKGIQFVLGSIPTGILHDAAGKPAGLVMANRAGRQAVVAKIIIDATLDATVAQQAGAPFRSFTGGPIEFRRIVLGGNPTNEEAIRRRIATPQDQGGQQYFEYALRLELPNTTAPALALAEQQARDLTYRPGQQRAAARLQFVHPGRLIGRRSATEWTGFSNPGLGHFQPRGLDRLYVAGSRADVSAEVAEQLSRATHAEAIGRLIGADAARQAAALPLPRSPRVAAKAVATSTKAELRESLTGLRPFSPSTAFVNSPYRALPVLGQYDVVIVGGGTAGAAAAIGATRRGARVLVAEFQEGLGGTGTLGLIGKPYHGRNEGFAKEVPFPSDTFTIDDKMEWYRKQIRTSGGEIWFGVTGAGAVVEAGRVRGVVLVTPQQRGVVLGKVIIDATGNADIAIAAGAEARNSAGADDLAMQGSGLPTRKPTDYYTNTDYLLVDENDMIDVWSSVVGARLAMPENAFDSGALIQTRERRRMVGEHTLTYLDQIAGRTYPDSIVYSASDYDSHGYPSDDIFALLPHDANSRKLNHPAPGGTSYTPYRCLLPKGLEGILVVGLGISMQRDASAMVRMQRDIANQGYAAGVAAATTAASRKPLRDLDVKALQRHLIEIGALPEAVLTHRDSFPLSDSEVRRAVQNIGFATNPEEAGPWLAVILTHKSAALPLLKQAYEKARPRQKLMYANLLAFHGVADVTPFLAESLDAITQWDARILQGKMAEYAHLPTPIDTIVLALGRTGDRRALPALLRKLETLDPTVTLSHHRSLAIALEGLADPAAAAPLARLLAKPGMRGHALTRIEPLQDAQMDQRRRLGPLREITLARALFRCGDHEGLGAAILKEYTNDHRGLLARHAQAVLAQPKPPVEATPPGRP
ncbi:MAG: FAD-dependent oxidoreductase [Bryobacterales bacterium]|nr:FAD-dependent oxidoreductase [Bryobacterales bacterium]